MKLIFVYNADSGVFNTLSDIAHKLFSPATYQCNLCNLTHGYFKTRDQWVNFLSDLDADIEFLHRDEYLKRNGDRGVGLPAIFVEKHGELNLWVDGKILNKMQSTDELMELIRAAVLRKQSGDEEMNEFLSLPV